MSQDGFRSLKLVIEVNLLKVMQRCTKGYLFSLRKLGLHFHQSLKGVRTLTASKDQYKVGTIVRHTYSTF